MITVKLFEIRLGIACDEALAALVREQLVRLPGTTVVAGLEASLDYRIEVCEEGGSWEIGERVFRVSPAGSARDFARDLVLFIGRKLQQFLEERGIFSLHASSVGGPSGGAAVFTGRSGSGKSTLALTLAAPDTVQISANQCLLTMSRGNPEIIGGCQFTRLRRGSLIHDFPWLGEILGVKAQPGEDPWGQYDLVPAGAIPGRERRFPYLLSAVYLPSRVPQAFRSRKIEAEDAFDRLFLEMSIFLRPSFFRTHCRLIPSFDSDAAVRARAGFIEQLLQKAPVTSLSGELTAMANFIRGEAWWTRP